MLPEDALSVKAHNSPFLLPIRPDLLTDYEWGGIGLNDPSQGLQVQIWTIYYEDGGVKIIAPNASPVTIFSALNITELSLAFDQNMRPQIAYVESGIAKLRWFDSNVGQTVTTVFDVTIKNPRVSLDDAREYQVGNSDVILAYIKEGNLCFRKQRQRFEVEYVRAPTRGKLRQIGMNKTLRFQFLMG